MKKIIIAIFLACMLLITSACSLGTVKKGKDKNKKEIVVSLTNGGYGTEWIEPAIAAFEKDYPKYEILLEKKKVAIDDIYDLIKIGRQADLYFSSAPDFYQGIYKDFFVDLTDVLDMEVDNTKIRDKLLNKDDWLKVTSKNGEGCYMLPYGDSISGFEYDHTKFLELGLLIFADVNDQDVKQALETQKIVVEKGYDKGRECYKFVSSEVLTNYSTGDTILRAGKDGKYGTYDDGQPVNISEWEEMFNKITAIGGYPIIYSGKVSDYTTDIFNGIFAQYDGLEAWNTFFDYDGEYKFSGQTTSTKITMENGYEVFAMEGIKKATEFLQKYLRNPAYVHPTSFISETSHTDAQGSFVVGSAYNTTNNPFSGLLVDGIWWENEAKPVFNGLVNKNKPNYKFGTRDYRLMLYPQIEGQHGIDGKGNGSFLAVRDTGGIVITKNKDADIIEKTKIFLSYTMTDKSLKEFTLSSGAIRPYKYDLTKEELSQLTKLGRNTWELYHDFKNIEKVRPLLDRYMTALPYKTSKGNAVNWYSQIGQVSYNIPILALKAASDSYDEETKNNPSKAVFEGFKKHYQKNWATYLRELKG